MRLAVQRWIFNAAACHNNAGCDRERADRRGQDVCITNITAHHILPAEIHHPAEGHPILHPTPNRWNLRQGQADAAPSETDATLHEATVREYRGGGEIIRAFTSEEGDHASNFLGTRHPPERNCGI